MERLKDFFYNKNDIVVALIILALAATIIYFRVNAIMDYPAKAAAQYEVESESVQEDPEEKKSDALKDTENSDENANGNQTHETEDEN